MKVVCCKNCGAKYQLDDDDDITTFECSSCAGDLEYLEDYSDGEPKNDMPFTESFKYDNSYIVQCEDCGLKYKIKSSDSILDYECDSCGGSLRYLDDEMNKELDKYLEERKKETSGKITKARRAFVFIFKSSTIWFLQGEAKEVVKNCYVKKQYFSFFHQ